MTKVDNPSFMKMTKNTDLGLDKNIRIAYTNR